MKVLLFNGAPRSGKDTAASTIKQWSSSRVHQEKFATPLKRLVPVAYGISYDEWVNIYDTCENKDKPFDAFFGRTPREVQIAASERFLKPLHNEFVFGNLLMKRLAKINKSCYDAIVISGGFQGEATALLDMFSPSDIHVIRIKRKGCDFSNDSREYIDLTRFGVSLNVINNNGTLEEFKTKVRDLYKKFVPTIPPKEFKSHEEITSMESKDSV